jgi:hypothetical protein
MGNKKAFQSNYRYHVKINKKPTTMSLSHWLADLLALHLGITPDATSVHKIISQWMQKKIDENKHTVSTGVNGWLIKHITLEMMDKELSRKYWDLELNH